MSTQPSISTLLLAVTTLFASYLSLRCFTPPNPTPNSNTRDRYFVATGPVFLMIRISLVILIGAYHTLLVLIYPNRSAICPHPENINPSLFTWNTYSIIYLSMILIAAPIRLLAFKQLGSNFTFRLAKPDKLVTTGLYKWVQHPSYITNIVVMLANGLLFERPDGVAGCWMSKGVVQSKWWIVVGWCFIALGVHAGRTRVVDEERMLKSAFGREWEEWHTRTRRFLPGLY